MKINKLNLGAGTDYREGWINQDIDSKDVYGGDTFADIYYDLNNYPYPHKDNQFEEILSKNVIEHIKDLDSHIKELSRISKSNCKLSIHAPYFLSYFSGREIWVNRFSLNCIQLFGIFNRYGWKLKTKKLNISNNILLHWINYLANINNFTQGLYERFPVIIPEGIRWEFERK